MSVWDSIKDTVGSVAPIAGSLLGGPAGSAVGSMIASALGVSNTPDAVAAAIKSDPQAAIKIRQIEAQLEQTRLEVRGQAIQAEATGESWLQRNWRPLTMIWFSILVGGYWFGYTPENLSEEAILSLFGLIKLGLGGYVLGRSAEKITKELSGSGIIANMMKSK
jgi:uncharacterized membrane protein YeaQ/YmgE (transglycosylase-associated protein family)